MEREKIIKERFRVFQTLIRYGYNTDRKLIGLVIEELVLKTDLNRSDLAIAVGIRNALKDRNLVTFLCGMEEIEKNKKETK